jgi:rod shape determining protein RodA
MVENFGIFGMFFVFYLYWLLLSSILKVYRNTNSTFVSTFALGTFIVFSLQTIQNIGTNVGLFPASGVVLPFMSYGGSGMLTNFIFLGTLNAIKDDKVYETETEETDLNLSPSRLTEKR